MPPSSASSVPAGALPPHLKRLEAEAIGVFREAVAAFLKPVLLYSIGKDSSAMLHLARKAFFPGDLPFPLLHVDTTWKFREMIAFRDRVAADPGVDLIVHINREGLRQGVSPVVSGSAVHTRVMKTEALKQALDAHGFDAILGGARRDEEKSRAKERLFSAPNCGVCSTRDLIPANRCGSFRCRTGRSWTSGNTSLPSASRSCRCTSRRSGLW
jgi:sulfate adenylyltransferase subunit 2